MSQSKTLEGQTSKKKKMTKTQLRDARDNAGFALSVASMGIGIASLVLALDRKSGRGEPVTVKKKTKTK